METLKDILWPIVLLGGLGALIDFLIGKTGQERAKDFLLKWWVRFDDVHWRNVGREEGLFTGRLIEKWFGRKMWSLRRLLAAFSTLSFLSLLGYLSQVLASKHPIRWCMNCVGPPSQTFAVQMTIFAVQMIISFIGFCVSVGFTKFIAFRAAYLCGTGQLRNLIVFVAMLAINYYILVLWYPMTIILKMSVINAILHNWNPFSVLRDLVSIIPAVVIIILAKMGLSTHFPIMLMNPHSRVFGPFNSVFANMGLFNTITYPIILKAEFLGFMTGFSAIDNTVSAFSSSIVSVFRFALAVVFVGSFLLRPLIMRPISLVWRRTVESDKPVFTIMFGGAAAFATAINEAAKHL
jgi:hypothetical protein